MIGLPVERLKFVVTKIWWLLAALTVAENFLRG
jgi:hypothetical protein